MDKNRLQEEAAATEARGNALVDIGIPEYPGTNERITQGILSVVDGGKLT